MNIHDPFNLLRTKQESIGKPPGTLTYSGNYRDVDIKIELITYQEDSFDIQLIGDWKQLLNIIDNSQLEKQIYWVNIIGLNHQELIESIGERLKIHHMDLEDIAHVSQWSKILDQGDYLFSVFKMIYLKDGEINHEHVSVIMKKNLVITFQETPGDVFDHIRIRIKNHNGQIRLKDSNFLYYSILDTIIDEYIVVLNHISIKYNEIEMKIIDGTNPDKEELYRLRKELLYFSNSIAPLIDSVRRFISEKNSFYRDEMAPYYSDINIHLNQVFESIKGYREMSNGLHEMHMSNVSMKMNKAMMTLTIFSAIFIPLSFLAGVFGMNFRYIPGLDNHNSFFIFISFCLILASGMITYFKGKEWF